MSSAKRAISPMGASWFGLGLAAALSGVLRPTAPAILMSLVVASLVAMHLVLFQPREVVPLTRQILLALVIVGWVAAAKAFLGASAALGGERYLQYCLPIAAAPMLVALLLDASLAALVAVLIAVMTAFVAARPPDAMEMATVFMAGGLAGALCGRRAERIRRHLFAAAAIAGVSLAAMLAFWARPGEHYVADVAWMVAASALGGILSAIVAVGGSVVLGLAFGVTTRFQLMSMSQVAHPLLRKLQEETPGTFHHSVIVGNLAERAADVIRADALLVRVGAYFHDIGKTLHPAYYVENQTGGENPYDKLDPLQSAQMVAAHVRGGIELAKEHGVPQKVRAFIPEHHGTRLITYFYRKAAAADADVDPEKFRYPGPKPQSKETAIVMLADSVEAIVRSSKDRSPERIESLVKAVIAERVQEGQLDDSDLTTRDLKGIAEAFLTTLRGVYHARVEYPSPAGGEKSLVASALGAPAPLVGPMDGATAPAEHQGPIKTSRDAVKNP